LQLKIDKVPRNSFCCTNIALIVNQNSGYDFLEFIRKFIEPLCAFLSAFTHFHAHMHFPV